MSFSYPPRLSLAQTPTPLVSIERFSLPKEVELLIKRDDMTGVALSGNKIRKLEFLLAEAQAQGADTVLTCGGEQSNHCRATAVAAARLGLRSLLFLRTANPLEPPLTEGNILLDRLTGAQIQWISPGQYVHRTELMAQRAEELHRQGHRPYVIPEGGSNALGSWGYVRGLEELLGQLAPGPATILYAAGSGGTGAGLILGTKLLGRSELRVVGVNVCDDRDYFVRTIGHILDDAVRRFELSVTFSPSDIEIVDGYVGRGYAQSRPEELRVIAELARSEGIFLDPVYTGKAFFGLLGELRKDPKQFGPRIVFLHTGGIFGLFPKAGELAQVIEASA